MIKEICRDCEDHDSFYGCMNHDCEVYQDEKSEHDYEMRREMAADDELEKRKDRRLGY